MSDEINPFDAPAVDALGEKIVRAGRPPNARVQATRVPRLSAREEQQQGTDYETTGLDGGERLVRRRSRSDDKYYVHPSKIPAGRSYEWKREQVYGQPDTDHQVNLRENHWTPVPASRHPEMMPIGDTGPVRKDGMILMERPLYVTQEAREEDYQIAMDQVRAKESQMRNTPGGTFTRDHPSVHRIARVQRSYGPIDAES
jgi:hypothetical protein